MLVLAFNHGANRHSAYMTKSKKILVVEDEIDIVDLLQSLLKSEGYEVASAYNGEDALKLLKSYTPDLILLDMNMPHMGGVSFYHQIYNRDKERSQFPVLVLTGRANMEKLFEELHVDGFLTKPFDIDRLLSEIERILQMRRELNRVASGLKEIPAPVKMRPKHILIVENDTTNFEKIAISFLSAGYTVNAVGNAMAAFERACASPPDLVLIRLDLANDMPGDLLACKFRSSPETSRIPIVLYAGVPQSGDPGVLQDLCKRMGFPEPLITPQPDLLLKTCGSIFKHAEAA